MVKTNLEFQNKILEIVYGPRLVLKVTLSISFSHLKHQ